jgi:hypothetical protein
MRTTRAVTALFAVVTLTGCTDFILGEQIIDGRGPVVSEERSVGRFTAVSNATAANIDILQGPTERLRVRAEESILPHVRARVEGGVLRVFTDPDVILRPREPITVELDVRTLDRLMNSGSGRMSAPLLDARRVEVVSSGSGDVRLHSLLADSIVVLASGSGHVTSTGNAQRLRIVHSGSGQLDLRELQVYEADATLSGSGSATVRVRDRLRATLSGSGSVRYYGNPTVTQTVTGAGRVERAGS